MSYPTADTFVGGGSGPGGAWTMADLGWEDPVLLAQINARLAPNAPPPGQDPRPRDGTLPPVGSTGIAPDFNKLGLDTSRLDLSGTANAACDLLPTEILRQACRALAGATVGSTSTTGCPKGYHKDPKTGGCVIDGPGSYIPGDVGQADFVWTPTAGRYGIGVTPIMVQFNKRACPAGFAVGKDGLCYDRLARTNRLHNPGAKPMLSGGDMNALRKAHSLQKQIGKIARRFGPKKAKVCPPKGKK